MDIRKEILKKYKKRSRMQFGIECGDGWLELIDKTLAQISEDGTISQIKEKFGTLRIYLCGGTERDWQIVAQAERDSAKICENCGEPARCECCHGWYMTLCEECKAKRGSIQEIEEADDEDSDEEDSDEEIEEEQS